MGDHANGGVAAIIGYGVNMPNLKFRPLAGGFNFGFRIYFYRNTPAKIAV